MEREEGEVKDLVKKLEGGEITAKEIIFELKKRGLTHHAREPIPGVFVITGMIIWVVLCFLPAIAHHIGILDFFTKLLIIKIPTAVSYLAIILAIVVSPMMFYARSIKIKKGGCRNEDHTIILLKEGAYRVLRHPEVFVGLIWFITAPIIFDLFGIQFTILSVLGEAVIILALFLQTKQEEKFNILKWGDEYRQYMKEVPRFNFILGLWRLRKRSLTRR